jgi:predicted alpha/beta-fold hydrolase
VTLTCYLPGLPRGPAAHRQRAPTNWPFPTRPSSPPAAPGGSARGLAVLLVAARRGMEAQVRSRAVQLGGVDLGWHSGSRRGDAGGGAASGGAASAAPRAVLWRLALRRAVATLRLAGTVALRPLAAVCAVCALAFAFPCSSRARRPAGRLSGLCVALVAAFELRRVLSDPIHRLWLGLDSSAAWSGLVHGRDARLVSVLCRAGLLADRSLSFSSPTSSRSQSCCSRVAYSGHVAHGDVSTLASAVLCRRANISFLRVCFPSAAFPSEAHGICLDWAFPALGVSATAVVVVLAGVGGDSSAGYVRAAVRAMTSRGWLAVVCGPRGLGNTPCVRDVRHLFDPSDVRDVVRALELVDHLSGRSLPLLLLGFSLGGITLCNVLGRCAGRLPTRLCGALSVSGAFRCDMLAWPRYERVYQPIIVPELLLDLCERYHSQLVDLLGDSGVDRLLGSTTYTELWERLYAPLQQHKQERPERPRENSGVSRGESLSWSELRSGSFAAWKSAQEGERYRQHIMVPLLLLSAADDPLHPPDSIGAPRGGAALDSELVAYLITERGGHVAWPESLSSPDFGFLTRLTTAYFSSCLSTSNSHQERDL